MALKPFYNKKYHLGMDPADVKAGLAAAGSIPAIESGDAGKAIVVNDGEDGFVLATVGGGGGGDAKYAHYIQIGTDDPKYGFIIVSGKSTAYTATELIAYISTMCGSSSIFIPTRVFVNNNKLTVYNDFYVQNGALRCKTTSFNPTITNNTLTFTESGSYTDIINSSTTIVDFVVEI